MNEDYERQFHQIRASDFMSIQNHEKIKNNLEPNVDQFVLKTAKKCLPKVIHRLKSIIPEHLEELHQRKEFHINKYYKEIENLNSQNIEHDINKLKKKNESELDKQTRININILRESVYRKFIQSSNDKNVRKLAIAGQDIRHRDFAFFPYLNAFGGMSFTEFLKSLKSQTGNNNDTPDERVASFFGDSTMIKALQDYLGVLCDYFDRQKDNLCDGEKYMCVQSILLIDELLLLFEKDPYNPFLKLAYFGKLKEYGLGMPGVGENY